MSTTLPVIQPSTRGQPPVFEKIGIIGLGLMGGSLAMAAREAWPAGLVVGVDRKDVLEQAMVRHAIDVGADDLVVVAEVDLVVLAAPVEANIGLLGVLDAFVRGSAVVTDLGSTKRAMAEAARRLPARLPFIGGHPLAGAARSGIEYARPDLFRGRPWLFTPGASAPPPSLERLHAFASGLGAAPRTLDVRAHDRLLASLSHLPQLTASALMSVVGEAVGEEGLGLAGAGLADTTRLATSPANVWKDICATNGDEIGVALDRLIAVLQDLRGDLPNGRALERVFDSAAAWKARMPAKPG